MALPDLVNLPISAGVARVDGGLDQRRVSKAGSKNHPADSRHHGKGWRAYVNSGRVSCSLFPGDGIHDFTARSFYTACGCASGKDKLVDSGMQFAGGQLGERLAKDLAALHDFKG